MKTPSCRLFVCFLCFTTTARGYNDHKATRQASKAAEISLVSSTNVRGGSWIVPSGWNPFGYQITSLGQEFLSYEGSLDSDIGRFLASLRERKRFAAIKSNWLEVLRVSKSGQSMRIYKKLSELIQFCLRAGFID
jgi:hypothetical protein